MPHLLRYVLVILFCSSLFTRTFAQATTQYEVMASFGGRFLDAGFNTEETIFTVVASTGVSFYDLTSVDLPLLNRLDFTNVQTTAVGETWVAIVYEGSTGDQTISLIDLTSRSIVSETFFTTPGSIEAIKFSADGSQLAILGTVQLAEPEVFLVVKPIDQSENQINATSASKRPVWELNWTEDGRFAAAEIDLGRGYLVIEPEIGANMLLKGSEIHTDNPSYSLALMTLLDTMNHNNGYPQIPTLITSATGDYRVEYQEHGIGTLSIFDTKQPEVDAGQIQHQFLGSINGLDTDAEHRLYINFTGEGLHCSFDIVLKPENQQLMVDGVIENECVHGYMAEFFTPLVATKPAESETASPYTLVVVRVNDMGLLSSLAEDRVLIEGHTAEIVYQHWLDDNRLLTLAQDQTARLWRMNNENETLQLVDVQIIELAIDPTSLVLFLENNRAIIKDESNHLQVFDFTPDSFSLGQHLQTISPTGGDYRWLEPAPDHGFYTLTDDNVIRLWVDVED